MHTYAHGCMHVYARREQGRQGEREKDVRKIIIAKLSASAFGGRISSAFTFASIL